MELLPQQCNYEWGSVKRRWGSVRYLAFTERWSRAEEAKRCCSGGRWGWARWKGGDRGATPCCRSSWEYFTLDGWCEVLCDLVCTHTLRYRGALCSPCCRRGHRHLPAFCSESGRPVVCAKGTFYLVSVGLWHFISCLMLTD